jgi:hypothetical protein
MGMYRAAGMVPPSGKRRRCGRWAMRARYWLVDSVRVHVQFARYSINRDWVQCSSIPNACYMLYCTIAATLHASRRNWRDSYRRGETVCQIQDQSHE